MVFSEEFQTYTEGARAEKRFVRGTIRRLTEVARRSLDGTLEHVVSDKYDGVLVLISINQFICDKGP